MFKKKSDTTVVLCCYNHERFFEEALNSIISQTKKPKTVILNNGANSSYTKTIRSKAKTQNIEICEIKENTAGLALREKIIPIIDTKYVAFLHDDDIYHKDKIKNSISCLKRGNYDFIVTNTLYINEMSLNWTDTNDAVNTGLLSSGEKKGDLLADFFIPPGCRLHFSTLTMKTTLARKTLLGDPLWPRISDCFFWAELLLNEQIKFGILPEILTKVRIHGDNDRLYEKFPKKKKLEQITLLGLSEIELLRKITAQASAAIMSRFLTTLLETRIKENQSRYLMLCRGAIFAWKRFNQDFFSRIYLPTILLHSALRINRLKTIKAFKRLSPLPLNAFMDQSYEKVAESILKLNNINTDIHDFKSAAYQIRRGLRWILIHPRRTILQLLRIKK